MINLQAAERCEPPRVIPELLTELPRPSIGSADVGVAVELGRDQGWTKRHLQMQLALGPLAHCEARVHVGLEHYTVQRAADALTAFDHQRKLHPYRRVRGRKNDAEDGVSERGEGPVERRPNIV